MVLGLTIGAVLLRKHPPPTGVLLKPINLPKPLRLVVDGAKRRPKLAVIRGAPLLTTHLPMLIPLAVAHLITLEAVLSIMWNLEQVHLITLEAVLSIMWTL